MNCPPPSEEAAMQGHVRKRRTWEFIVDIGRHPITGRRRQKSKSGFATKKEAESALHEFIRYVEGGGEVLGISWEDADLKTGTIFIRRGVQPVRDAGRTDTATFTPLKTKRARRVVQLPPFALERIQRHRRDQLKRRIALGPGWHDPLDGEGRPVALVCERGDGPFLYPDSFSSAFKRLANRAGLHPSTRLHDVRHTVATELGRQGVHPVIVSAVLGHASPAFTIAVYQHAWQEGPAEAAQALETALQPSPALAIRWQTGRSSRPETRWFSRNSRSEAWGGEDLNLRPTDYESGKALTCRNS